MPTLQRHGNKWRFQYRDKTVPKGQDNRRYRTIEDWEYDQTKQDAERVMHQFLGLPARQRTSPGKEIFLPYAHETIDTFTAAEKTKQTWRKDIDHHCGLLHHKRVAAITADDLAAVVREMRTKPRRGRVRNQDEPYSENTIRNVFVPLNKIFKRAERQGIIPRGSNPIKLLEPGERAQPEKVEQRLPTGEEAVLLLQAAIDFHRRKHVKYAGIIAIALWAGLRRSEILRLTWDDIDFDNRLIHIRKDNRIFGKGKTKNAIRPVEMAELLYDILWQHRLELEVHSKLDLVFCTRTGKPLSPRNVSLYVDQILVRSGIWTGADDKRLKPTLHPLRHTFGSVLSEEGVNIKYVSAQMGHSSAGFTLSRYVHEVAKSQHKGAAAAAIDAYWGPAFETFKSRLNNGG